MPISVDCGTRNLICARRGESGEIKYKKEVNAFLQIPLENPYTFNMLKKAKVKLIERESVAYVAGEAAVNLAYTLNLNLRRPMKDGCLNPHEQDAFRILSIMIHSLIGEVDKDRETVYFSVPANAINTETDADYHTEVLKQIFRAYNHKGKTLQAFPINEALALIFAELADRNFTGIGISCGAGQMNLCYAIFSQPVFSFSLVNSGDWIDQQAARACNESVNVINREKEKIDLLKAPTSLVERAIQTQYRILIDKAVNQIKKAITESDTKVRTEVPLDIVLSGGTSSPTGFETWFKEAIEIAKLAIPVGEIRKPKDTLNTVAKGILIAAENS